MPTIERAGAFRRDYKRVKAWPRHRQDVARLAGGVVALVAADRDLPCVVRRSRPDRRLIGIPRASPRAGSAPHRPHARRCHPAADQDDRDRRGCWRTFGTPQAPETHWQRMWAKPDVCRLLAINLGYLQNNVGREGRILSANLGRNRRCLQVRPPMFASRYRYGPMITTSTRWERASGAERRR